MVEHVISGVGLLALLALAFAFSNNRKAVNPRTVVWGVGLQMLFGVIILQEDAWSYGGMFLLIFVVLLYIFEKELAGVAEHELVPVVAGVLVALIVLGLLYTGWHQALILIALCALVTVGAGVRLSHGMIVMVASALAAGLFAYLARYGVTGYVIAAASIALLVAIRLDRTHVTRVAFASLLILGWAQLVAIGVDGQEAFGTLSEKVSTFLELSNEGAAFLFGNLIERDYFFTPEDAAWPGFGFQFAFLVLPTIIFFSAFMSVMYYLGVVQVIVQAMARFMRWSLRTSGSETLSCSANVFVGQTEAPFLIKPFLKDMTTSELHAVMVGGFATIAGGVLAAYIGMGVSAQHLIAASVMSAPAALVIAKLLFPETEESLTAGDVDIPEVKTANNVVEAAADGTIDGLKLALNVGAMLIAFIALIAFLDMVLAFGDRWVDGALFGREFDEVAQTYPGYFPGSMRTLFGVILAPLALIMGVPWGDAMAVGNLLGIKMTINEFVAYGELGLHINAGELSERSRVIATYALCGFANFSSIGIQIGGISALEPSLRPTLSKIAVRALFGGALASFTTATVAGLLL